MNSSDKAPTSDEVVQFAGKLPAAGLPTWHPSLPELISARVSQGQRCAKLAVNQTLIRTCWHVGRAVLDGQSEQGWGTKVSDWFFVDLRDRNHGIKGLSSRNLKYVRSFAEAWSAKAIVQQPVAQLPWGHNLVLLDKLDDESTRIRYARMPVSEEWSRNHIVHQVETRLQERSGQASSNFEITLQTPTSVIARDLAKNPYIFDFLKMTDARNEKELEVQLMQHVERFLLELGRGFAFVGRQLRLDVAEDELFPELVFYKFILRRFVVVELKATKFEPGPFASSVCLCAPLKACWRGPEMNPQSVYCYAIPRTLWWPSMRCAVSGHR